MSALNFPGEGSKKFIAFLLPNYSNTVDFWVVLGFILIGKTTLSEIQERQLTLFDTPCPLLMPVYRF
jgi:hypothetical protein